MEQQGAHNQGLWILVFNIVSFMAVVFILGKWGWPPILKALKTREEQIRKDLEAAQKAREDGENSRKELERQLAALNAKAETMMSEAKRRAEEAQGAILRQAGQDAKDLLEKTKSQLIEERQQLLVSLRSELGTLVALATEKIMRRQNDADLHAKLVAESLREIDNIRRV